MPYYDLECLDYDLKKTLNTLPGIWCVVDNKSRYVFYNKAFRIFFEVDQLEEDFLIGKTRDKLPDNINKPIERFLYTDKMALKSKKDVRAIHTYIGKNREWVVVEVIKRPILNCNGEVEAIVIRYIDQTSNHHLDLAMAIAKKVHQQNNESLGVKILILNNKKCMKLKPKESECLFYIMRGVSYRQISEVQKVSYRTVVEQVQRLKLKFNASTRGDLLIKALSSACFINAPASMFNKSKQLILTKQ
jgi:DNA-binding CsgD family transcriptional regulator